MCAKKGAFLYYWFTIAIVFVFTYSLLLLLTVSANAQSGGKTFNILVKINGENQAIENVTVEVTGTNLDQPINDTSKPNGWVTFSKVESGSYTIMPGKDGFFFTPSKLTITLGDESKKRTLITFLSTKGSAPPEEGLTIPFEEEWANSAHADTTAEAFNYWNEDDPQEIPTSCAKCHSSTGLLDFLGDDGTAPDVVDNPAAVGTVITCEVCHNDTAVELDSVTFPSGKVIDGLGHEAVCMTCHQGRSSTISVNSDIETAEVDNDDVVSEELGFINIHYFAASATLYGTFAEGGYQYDGKEYDARFEHEEDFKTCVKCHDQHSLEIRLEVCATCHTDVKERDDLVNIRMNGSLVDYDGDGDISEGIFFEIDAIRDKLYMAIQTYANEVSGTPIVYEEHTYPYFFIDTNANGEPDEDEANFGNQYSAWSARLVKAAYNYQVSLKDPGAYAHGGKYIIQLMYDSIEDVNSALTTPVDMAAMSRNDEGHFAGSSESFRHWDEDGEVEASCAKCHGAGGFVDYIENDANIAVPVSNGMLCSTCHSDLTDLSIKRDVGAVTFPSGLTADLNDDSNICMLCHQGRSSKGGVNEALAASDGPYSFINLHYYPVAAVLFGTTVEGGYEYDGKDYVGQNTFDGHGGIYDTCVECHMGVKGAEANKSHNVTSPNPANCVVCHGNDVSQANPGDDPEMFNFEGIRPDGFTDYDGDGDVTESLWSEIKGLETSLFAEIQVYALTLGQAIVYESHTYPYFFMDTNGNGEADEDEANFGNRYVSFDANLLRAAYNYQTSLKEPAGYNHNGKYISQLLVDSIEALGGDVSAFTWR